MHQVLIKNALCALLGLATLALAACSQGTGELISNRSRAVLKSFNATTKVITGDEDGYFMAEINLESDACRSASAAQQDDLVALSPAQTKINKVAPGRLLAAGELLVLARDEAGNELFRTIEADPRLRRPEVFALDGSIEHQELDLNEAAHLFTVIERPLEIAVIKIYQANTSDLNAKPQLIKIVNVTREEIEHSLNQGLLKLAATTPATKTTIRKNGDPTKKVDLVLIGDGYTQAEMKKWETDAEKVANGFLAAAPFAAFAKSFNVHRIDLASAESGASDPVQNLKKSTALGVYFNCQNIERLTCADNNAVYTHVNAVSGDSEKDIILVVSNTTRYGGSGGAFAVITMANEAIDLALHEVAHSFAGLADEYDYGTCANGGPNGDLTQPNVTTNRNAATLKWKDFIKAGQGLVTDASAPNGTVGLFEGGNYCVQGVFRPTFDSKMRNLAQPFHAVNEAIIAAKIKALAPEEVAMNNPSTTTPKDADEATGELPQAEPRGDNMAKIGSEASSSPQELARTVVDGNEETVEGELLCAASPK